MIRADQVTNFKKERVPNKILLLLFNAVEMLGALKYKTNNCSCMDIVSEMMLIRELRYSYAIAEKDVSFSDNIYDLFSTSMGNEFHSKYRCVKKCIDYATETTTTMKMLPAIDFLRINHQIMAPQQDFLHYESFASVLENESKEIWKIIDGLCNYRPYLHELLEIALTAYWLEDLKRFDTIDIFARSVLFSSYLKTQGKTNHNIVFLHRLYLLYDDFVALSDSDNISEYVVFFLDKLTVSFKELYVFIESVELLISKDDFKIETELPKIYSEALIKILRESLGVKYTDLSEKLNVTPKTAQEYLKILEQLGILKSKKVGKERIFVSSSLLMFLEDEL